jgi:hypothetical protein
VIFKEPQRRRDAGGERVCGYFPKTLEIPDNAIASGCLIPYDREVTAKHASGLGPLS